MQREPEVRRDVGSGPLRDGTAGVIDGAQDPARMLLELGEVVVLPTHEVPQLDVGAPCHFRGRRPLVAETLDLAVEREHRAQRVVREGLADAERVDPQRLEGRPLHRPLERDLERRALVERLGLEQLVDRGAERLRDRAQEGQLRLALTGLDHRQLARGALHSRRKLFEGHPARRAQLPDAPADREGVGGIRFLSELGDGGSVHRHERHSVTEDEFLEKFTWELVTHDANLHSEWCHGHTRRSIT